MMQVVMACTTTLSATSCCPSDSVRSDSDARRRAWLVLTIMLVVVLRSSLICHNDVISSEKSIDALISGSYCSTSGNTPTPQPDKNTPNDHAACLHCVTRRRLAGSSDEDSV